MDSEQIIFHLVPLAEWQRRDEASGKFLPQCLEDSGFIPCTAEKDRLLMIANMFYSGEAGEFVVLTIDKSLLSSKVTMETSLLVEDGLPFPHIGGPIDLAAVKETHSAVRDAEGSFSVV